MTYPVATAFDAIAHRYDLLVGCSPGYHRQLAGSARAFVDRLRTQRRADPAAIGAPVGTRVAGESTRGADEGTRGADEGTGGTVAEDDSLLVLDLGCGSGASTRALCRALERLGAGVRIVGIDASEGMIREAGKQDWPAHVSLRHARAQDLAGLEQTRDADGIFAAYLLRNVPERGRLLHDLHDTLRSGGTLVVHDYFRPASRLGRLAWSALSWIIIIPLSAVVTRRPGLFVYLWRSVRDFETVDAIADALRAAGFEDVTARPVRGWEQFVVHTVTARRPE